MKYKGLGLAVIVVLGLAGCKSAASLPPKSQNQQLLKAQKERITHSVVKKAASNIRVLVPQSEKKWDLVDPATYKQFADAELSKVKGEKRTKAAYVTFTGTPTYRNFWRLIPSVRVYQNVDGKTKLKRTTKLDGLNVDMVTGAKVTLASLVTGPKQMQALNYRAFAQAVAHKGYTSAQLQQARQIGFFKNLQAANFRLAADSLTIYPDKNQLGIKQLKLPMSSIAGYLTKLNKVREPDFRNKKVVALTFDDGPNPKTTPTVLATLKKEHVKATFFMVGYEVKANPQLTRAVVHAGHEVGTHTYDHKSLAYLNPADALQEIVTASDAMYAATGTMPMMMRPPYGAVNAAHDSSIPLPSIQWAVDSQDWRVHAPGPIIARINASTYPGSIILMHDIHPQSVAALPNVIKSLKAKGYSFVTVSELLGKYLLPGEQYFGSGDHRAI